MLYTLSVFNLEHRTHTSTQIISSGEGGGGGGRRIAVCEGGMRVQYKNIMCLRYAQGRGRGICPSSKKTVDKVLSLFVSLQPPGGELSPSLAPPPLIRGRKHSASYGPGHTSLAVSAAAQGKVLATKTGIYTLLSLLHNMTLLTLRKLQHHIVYRL